MGFMQPLPVQPNTLIASRTLPAKDLAGVVGLFIVTDEHPDDGPVFRKISRLVKVTSETREGVTFTFYDGRDPITVAHDQLIESHIIFDTPPS